MSITPRLVFREGTEFNGSLYAEAARVDLHGGVFNAPTSLVQTGANSSSGIGGCVFNDDLQLTNTGGGTFQLHSTLDDAYNGNVEVRNTGGGSIRFGSTNGIGRGVLADGRTITAAAGAFDSGILRFQHFHQVGGTPQSIVLGGNATMVFREGTEFDAPLNAEAHAIMLSGGTFHGPVNILQTGNSSGDGAGGCVFHSDLMLANHGAGNLRLHQSSNDVYHGDVVVNNTGGGTIRFGTNEGSGQGVLVAGRTLSVGPIGFDGGRLLLYNFIQQDGTPQHLELTGSSELYLYNGTVFTAPFRATAPRILLREVTFHDAVELTKTGGSSDSSPGGNTFHGPLSLISTGTGQLQLHVTFDDVYEQDITVSCVNGGGIHFGSGSSTGMGTLAPGRTVSVGPGGFDSGTLLFNNFAQLGTTAQHLALTGTSELYFWPGTVFNAPLTASAARIYLRESTFHDAVELTKTGGSSDSSPGGNTFHGPLSLTSTGTGQLQLHVTFDDVYEQDITVSCVNGGGIRFGSGTSTGMGTLAPGRTVSVGPGGFDSGTLLFNNFVQLGNTAQHLALTGTSELYFWPGTVFNAPLTASAARIYLRESTFHDAVELTKTGGSSDSSPGGNTFHGPLRLISSGTGQLRMYTSISDVYHGDIEVGCLAGGGVAFGLGSAPATGTLAAGRTISVASTGFDAGLLYFRNFIQAGTASQVLELTGTALLQIESGTLFEGSLNCTAPRVLLNGGNFQASSLFHKTGPDTDSSTGGNVYHGTTTLVNSGSGEFRVCNTGSDLFNGNIILGITGGAIRFGNGGGIAMLAPGSRIEIAPEGFSNGTLALRNFQHGEGAASTLTASGTSTIVIQTGCEFNAPMTTVSDRLFLNGGTFNAPLHCTKYGPSTDQSIGGCTFNSPLDLVVTGSGFLDLYRWASDAYNHDVRVACTGTGGIRFGVGNFTATLASGRTISVGPDGFGSGTLQLRNFIQQGTTPQQLLMAPSGTGLLQVAVGTVFHGDLSTESPGLLLDGGTFHGMVDMTKRGAANNSSRGGNTFHAATSLKSAGTGHLLLANQVEDAFLGDAELVRTGTGPMHVAYSRNTTFRGNISLLGSTGTVIFGQNNGRVIIEGPGDRQLDGPAAFPPPMRHLHMNTSSGGKLILNVTVDVNSTMRFEDGVIVASATHSSDNGLLRFAHNSSFPIPAHAGSYVDGFVRKTGNSAFTFPVGHGSVFAPISISAPNNSTFHFTARYLNEDPDALYHVAAKEPTINNVSRCEHWILDRTNGNSNVTVTLGWEQPRSCEVNDLPTLQVVRWDGAMWRDQGNGGTTGDNLVGTVMTSGPVTSFSPFTLASMGPLNPLPVELLGFDAIDEEAHVHCMWSTLSERMNDHFVVQRSVDTDHFETIGTVQGAGNSLQRRDYTFIDRMPLYGFSYYRLLQVDTDGTTTPSPIVAVFRSRSITIKLYPNPATEQIYIALSEGGPERALVHVLDASGRAVLTIDHAPEQGPIHIGNLAQGVYTLLLQHADGTRSEARFIKQ